MTIIANSLRKLSQMFPQFFAGGSAKHDHYRDFGWPEILTFNQLYQMYSRNSLAAGAIDKTIGKTWQDDPAIWESEEAKQSEAEAEIAEVFENLRIWQAMAEADKRSMVGNYAALILRVRDDQQFDQPVTRVNGGLKGLAGVIPAWESQLKVSEWDTDPLSENYGQPTMYQFSEAALGGNLTNPRQFLVHPDRVIIWSDDGTVNGNSALEPGFNDLIDAEKIKGAGGEGFWKTSRGAPVISAAEGLTPTDVAANMGVAENDLLDKINKQLDSFQQGFDKGLLLGGMTAVPMTITLPSPEHFFAAPVNSFASSMQIPVKILMGSQTGERASTEDAQEWALTCNSRRVKRCRPLVKEFINRLEQWGIIAQKSWSIGWQDLTESTTSEKMLRATSMSSINAQTQAGYEPAFTPDEIREAAGYKPLDVEPPKVPPEDDPALPGEDE